MNNFLEKLFGVNGESLDEGEEDILAAMPQEQKQALYDDTIHFFETMYGVASDDTADESADAAAEDAGAAEAAAEGETTEATDEFMESADTETWDYVEETSEG